MLGVVNDERLLVILLIGIAMPLLLPIALWPVTLGVIIWKLFSDDTPSTRTRPLIPTKRHENKVQRNVVAYSIYDSEGRQIYIGTTNDPKRRAAEHYRTGKLEHGGSLVIESDRMTRQNAERLEARKLADYKQRTGRLPKHNKTFDGR
jgi:predicted GIY-YIG superfamily endonuclease